jgi:hypothetical protein
VVEHPLGKGKVLGPNPNPGSLKIIPTAIFAILDA